MNDNDKTQSETLADLCAGYAGEPMDSPRWVAAASLHDWSGHYPVVDKDGALTGDIVDCADNSITDYANVDDMAVVAIADLPTTEQKRIRDEEADSTWNGYATIG